MQSTTEILNTHRGNAGFGKHNRNDDDLLFSTVKGSQKGTYVTNMCIYPKLLRQANFQITDKLDLLFDRDTKEGRLVLSNTGRRLFIQGSGKKRTVVSFAWKDGMPSIDGIAPVVNVTATAGQIDFTFPKGTSFNGVARENEEGAAWAFGR
jgi:hypothetical protein